MNTNKLSPDELKGLMVDVRKSYRFLYLFQQRILDLVKTIETHYSFEYWGAWSHYSKPFRNGKGRLDNWAWDYLPMYHNEFGFTCPELKTNPEIKFSILVQCDSGFYDMENPTWDKKLQVEAFGKPEDSMTMIHLVLFEENRKIQDYKDARVKSSSDVKFDDKSEEGFIVGYKFPLENMLNEISTKAELNKFTQHVKQITSIVLKELSSEIENS